MSLYVPSFVFLLGMATNRLVFPWMILRSRTTKQSSKMIVAYPFSFSLSDTGKTFTSVIRILASSPSLNASRDEEPSSFYPVVACRQFPPRLPRRAFRREEAEPRRSAPRQPRRRRSRGDQFATDRRDLRMRGAPRRLEIVPDNGRQVRKRPERRDAATGRGIARFAPEPRVPLPRRKPEGGAHDD